MRNIGAMERKTVLEFMENAFIFTDIVRWWTAGELCQLLGIDANKMWRILNFLESQGRVVKKKRFGYANEWRCLTDREKHDCGMPY